MSKREGQKGKLLALLRILEQQTDSNHLISVPRIIELLEKQEITCERKSLYDDIETLRSMGYSIENTRGRSGGYYLADRDFELAELKLLVDAVQSCRFISKHRSDKLIKKLEGLTSLPQAKQLHRQVFISNRVKSGNNAILYITDTLFEAIRTGRQVRFHYHNDETKDKVRTVSPWQLVWEDGRYYLIAYQDYREPAGISHYRVDRMSHAEVLAAAPCKGQEVFEGISLADYTKTRFGMFGGEEYSVVLRCENQLKQTMQDRFGTDFVLVPELDGRHFHFTRTIAVSDQFLGWVCGFGGKVTVKDPPEVRRMMAELTERMREAHAE